MAVVSLGVLYSPLLRLSLAWNSPSWWHGGSSHKYHRLWSHRQPVPLWEEQWLCLGRGGPTECWEAFRCHSCCHAETRDCLWTTDPQNVLPWTCAALLNQTLCSSKIKVRVETSWAGEDVLGELNPVRQHALCLTKSLTFLFSPCWLPS